MLIKSAMKLLTITLLGLCLMLVTAAAQISKLDYAVDKAMYYKKGTKNVRISHRHGFNMKPVYVKRVYRSYRVIDVYVKGQLSHRISKDKDDQYFFNIAVNSSGQVFYLKERIKYATRWQPVVRPGIPPVGTRLGADAGWQKVPLNAATFNGTHWEADARRIAKKVALRAAQICLAPNAPAFCSG